MSKNENLLYRTLLALVIVAIASALRIAPHPWNFTPVGAMALFSGAVIKNRCLALTAPLVALFAGDIFIGFHKLMLVVYASFLVSVAIGFWLRDRRTVTRITLATVLGAVQFFIVADLGVWALMPTYPHTWQGLLASYVAALPFLLNMLAGDAVYAILFFGAFAMAERLFPVLREPSFERY